MTNPVPPPTDPEVRIAIEDLLTEFAHRVDNGHGATLHELFVEEGSISTPDFTLSGREPIRERFTARAQDTTRRSRHYWSNLRLEQSGDEARATTNALTVMIMAEAPLAVMAGSSSDTFARRDGVWLFRSRSLEVVFQGQLQRAAAQ